MVHQLNTVVAVVYRPPDTRMSEFSDMLGKLDTCLASLPAPTPTIALMGDFNFPRNSLVWSRCGDDDDIASGDIVPIVAGHRDDETVGGNRTVSRLPSYVTLLLSTAWYSKLTNQPMG